MKWQNGKSIPGSCNCITTGCWVLSLHQKHHSLSRDQEGKHTAGHICTERDMELLLPNTNRISSFKYISNKFDDIQIYWVFNFYLLTKLVISLSISVSKNWSALFNILENNCHQQFLIQSATRKLLATSEQTPTQTRIHIYPQWHFSSHRITKSKLFWNKPLL